MQGYTTLEENKNMYVTPEQAPQVIQPPTIYVPYNEIVALQQKYPHPQFLVPVTIVPTAPQLQSEMHAHQYPQPASESGCCAKPNFKSLGHGVLAFSILFLL